MGHSSGFSSCCLWTGGPITVRSPWRVGLYDPPPLHSPPPNICFELNYPLFPTFIRTYYPGFPQFLECRQQILKHFVWRKKLYFPMNRMSDSSKLVAPFYHSNCSWISRKIENAHNSGFTSVLMFVHCPPQYIDYSLMESITHLINLLMYGVRVHGFNEQSTRHSMARHSEWIKLNKIEYLLAKTMKDVFFVHNVCFVSSHVPYTHTYNVVRSAWPNRRRHQFCNPNSVDLMKLHSFHRINLIGFEFIYSKIP